MEPKFRGVIADLYATNEKEFRMIVASSHPIATGQGLLAQRMLNSREEETLVVSPCGMTRLFVWTWDRSETSFNSITGYNMPDRLRRHLEVDGMGVHEWKRRFPMEAVFRWQQEEGRDVLTGKKTSPYNFGPRWDIISPQPWWAEETLRVWEGRKEMFGFIEERRDLFAGADDYSAPKNKADLTVYLAAQEEAMVKLCPDSIWASFRKREIPQFTEDIKSLLASLGCSPAPNSVCWEKPAGRGNMWRGYPNTYSSRSFGYLMEYANGASPTGFRYCEPRNFFQSIPTFGEDEKLRLREILKSLD